MKPRPYHVGFTCGAFDLLHAGHMLMFKEAKEVCEYLIVGLQGDPSIDRPQKNKPIMSIEERLILVEGNKYIDHIWVYDTEAELLAYLTQNARRNGGHIDVRILDEHYKDKHFTGKDLPIDVHYNGRGHNYSTTRLRERVVEAEHRKLQRAA